jgi:AcrR family transcriptional regulator
LKIQQSFIGLLKEKQSFESVSIVDICRRAEVHRTTFYLHFNDKYELLDKCLLDILSVPESEVLRYSDLMLEEKIFNLMKIVAESCTGNADFLLLILEDGRYPVFYSRFVKELEKQISKQIDVINRSLRSSGKKLNEYCSVFLSSALFGSIMYWAKSGEMEDLDRYCRSITTYVIAALNVDV